jgi:hypothetical protein
MTEGSTRGTMAAIESWTSGPSAVQTDPRTGVTYAWNGYGWVPIGPYPPAGNGLAVAGFVLGLLAVLSGCVPFFFVVTLVLAALALVFGLVGRSRAARLPSRPHHGLAVAAIALGSVAVAMGVGGLVLTVAVFDEFEDDLREFLGPADPADYDIGSVRCVTDDGPAFASGTITNTSDEARTFSVTVRFETPGGVLAGIERTGPYFVAPGASARWVVDSGETLDAGSTCTVSQVSNF